MSSTRQLYSKFSIDRAVVDQILEIAPLFDVTLVPGPDGNDWVEVRDGDRLARFQLPHAISHLRVLTEVCEKLVPWVYFHDGEHCAKSLLRQAGCRLPRLLELYRAHPGTTTAEKTATPGGAAVKIMQGSGCPSVH